METTRPLADALSKIVSLNEQEIDFIVSKAEYAEYAKGEFLTKEGNIERYVFFIQKGGVRIYCLQNGEELSLDFYFEGSFTNSFMSFLLQEKSIMSVQALFDTTVIRLQVDYVQQLYVSSLNLNKAGRIIAESLYIRRTKLQLSFITQSAKQRYDTLLSEHPEFIQRIPLKYLASFLGINPETLSRIRKAPSLRK